MHNVCYTNAVGGVLRNSNFGIKIHPCIFFFLFQLYQWHMEVSRVEMESEGQLQPMPQLQPCWILNPCTTVGTP